MPFVTFISWCKGLINKKRMEEAEPLLPSPLVDARGRMSNARGRMSNAPGRMSHSRGCMSKFVLVTDLNFLRVSTHINYLLGKVTGFLGCFSRNQLPPFPKTFPKSMVINTGHSSGPGIHWVAMILLADKCLYFDPFGVSIVETDTLDYVKS